MHRVLCTKGQQQLATCNATNVCTVPNTIQMNCLHVSYLDQYHLEQSFNATEFTLVGIFIHAKQAIIFQC